MYFNKSIMYTSDFNKYNQLYCVTHMDKITGVCTNKMHNVESAFVTNSIGYRAKNDPGD